LETDPEASDDLSIDVLDFAVLKVGLGRGRLHGDVIGPAKLADDLLVEEGRNLSQERVMMSVFARVLACRRR